MRNEGCVMKTVCPLVDTCGLMAMVSEGRVVRIKGDPGHSIMREFIDKNPAVTKYPHASAYPGGVMIGPRLCSFTESSCGSAWGRMERWRSSWLPSSPRTVLLIVHSSVRGFD